MTKYLLILWIILLAGHLPVSARSSVAAPSANKVYALAIPQPNLLSASLSGDPLLGFVSAPPDREYSLLLPLIEENEDNVNDNFKKQIRVSHQLVTLLSVWIGIPSLSLGQVPEASSLSIALLGDRYLHCRVLRL